MKLGIVGSRNFHNYEDFKKCIIKIVREWSGEMSNEEKSSNGEISNKIEVIVSGGAVGTDTMAERFAQEMGIQTQIFKPDWSQGRHAALLRNTDIVNHSTHVIAFPARTGRGTQDSIRKSQKRGVPLKVLYID